MSDTPTTAPRIGVLVNRRSGRNRAGLGELRALIERSPEVMARETTGRAEAAAALREMDAAGVEALAVAGGDGTLHNVFHLLFNEGARRTPPPIAVLPGGTTNMIGYDIGAARKPAKELKRLLARLRAGELAAGMVRRRLIALRTGPDAVPAYGLFGGAAGVYQGTMLSRKSVNKVGLRDAAGPLAGLLGLVGPLLLGRNPVDPASAIVTHDGVVEDRRDYIAIAVSTMERLIMGLTPFWGEGPGALRLTTVAARPKRFSRAILPALNGRRTPDLTPENGYRSVNADSITLDMEGGFVLDGEIFPLRAGRPLLLDAGPVVEFVVGGK
ncbi:MAG: acylglycerol kinase family protein [Rhodospirillales bacterium]|nr:MAG: acylglycerol kinase family protein [Rhodospirillales bacterium]